VISPTLSRNDLDLGFDIVGDEWELLRGARILVTGGTGFVGRNLLALVLYADERLSLGLCLEVLSRDAASFALRAPELAADRRVRVLEGDVTRLSTPGTPLTHVVHGAASTSARWNAAHPDEATATIVEGTRRALDAAQHRKARRVLFISSGAVYGRQPPQLPRIAEEFEGRTAPLDPGSTYAEGKRLAEQLCLHAADGEALEVPIARLFAFVGPYLPLDEHFAAGNFLRDALAGGPIRIAGDGTPRRSYLYSVELAAWLAVLLIRGRSGRAYNVGNERDVSIRELAEAVAQVVAPACRIEIAGREVPGRPPERYVPDTMRARAELGLVPQLDLSEAIRRTADWWRRR
jgi:nucleoside-diphosphate-sugar epimerase